jgi:hypothetical protein
MFTIQHNLMKGLELLYGNKYAASLYVVYCTLQQYGMSAKSFMTMTESS